MKQAKMTIEGKISAFNPYFYGRIASSTRVELTFEYEYLHNVEVLPYKFFIDAIVNNENYAITIDGDFAPISEGDSEFRFVCPFASGIFEVIIDDENIFGFPKVLWWETRGDYEDGNDYTLCDIKRYGFVNK